MTRKVDFFIAGVQKGGTSALDFYLRSHPQIQMGRRKELHFFDKDELVWPPRSYDRLHRHFDWSKNGVIRGEATPIYVYWPPALPRLQQYNPAAKIIIGLRHPSFRAHSQWRQATARGIEPLSFGEAISDFGRDRVRQQPLGVFRRYSYIERGLYVSQIERLLSLFPRDQVHFFRTDALWQDMVSTLTAIETFLEIDHCLKTSVRHQVIVPRNTGEPAALPEDLRPILDAIFAADIRRAAELSNLDLADWLDRNYREPMIR